MISLSLEWVALDRMFYPPHSQDVEWRNGCLHHGLWSSFGPMLRAPSRAHPRLFTHARTRFTGSRRNFVTIRYPCPIQGRLERVDNLEIPANPVYWRLRAVLEGHRT